MKNGVVKFDFDEVDDYIVSDYFSKKTNVYDLRHTAQEYLDIYKLSDNEKIEGVSYTLYGTTDYWDIILLLNDRNPLFDFPYDYDATFEAARKHVNAYVHFTYSGAPLIVGVIAERLGKEFLEKAIAENERNRYLLIVKPNKMSDFIKVLRDGQFI